MNISKWGCSETNALPKIYLHAGVYQTNIFYISAFLFWNGKHVILSLMESLLCFEKMIITRIYHIRALSFITLGYHTSRLIVQQKRNDLVNP